MTVFSYYFLMYKDNFMYISLILFHFWKYLFFGGGNTYSSSSSFFFFNSMSLVEKNIMKYPIF